MLNTAHFNALELPKETKVSVAAYILLYNEGSFSWVSNNVPETTLLKFVTTVESKYLANPFHNFSHGLDVLYSVARFVKLIAAERFLTEAIQFWLLVAALAHDVGHLGVNNQYLVETAHDLAVKYNDRSPMENMHCATLFQITGAPETNVFVQIDRDLYKEMRKGIIAAILHTDMTKHGDMIKELGLLYQMNSDAFDHLDPAPAVTQSQANAQLVVNALMHCADISNPMKPWELCYRYAQLCLDEFFAQGDLEKAAGIPVQMLNDRDKVNRPNSQVGFIEFVITPMCEVVVNIFPQLDGMANDLGHNVMQWCTIWQEESNPPPDAYSKVEARCKKVALRCKAVMRKERGLSEG